MARIVIDARTIASSSGRYIQRLLEYLQKIDKKNDYKVLVRPTELEFWKPTAKNFQLVEAPFADFSIGEQLGLYRLLKRLQPDLAHFGFPQHPILYRGAFVSTIHDLTMLHYTPRKWYELWHTFKRWVFRLVFRRAVRRAQCIITPTSFVRGELIKELAAEPDKVVVTYEAADKLSSKSKSYPSLRDTPFLLYVGQATPYKNLQRLAEAFALLKPTYPDLKLVFVGKQTDWYKRLEVHVQAQNIADVIFTGFMPDEQLAWLYEQAQAYVFPSLSEGFGLPALEAMLHGCPVIASSASCIPEVCADAALYFDPLNVDDMATIINRVLSDVSERTKLIAAGRKRVKDFSWQRMAEQTLKIYQDVLN